MTAQIRRADFPDYASYLDAICAPVGGVDSRVVWDEEQQEWVLDHEDDDSTDARGGSAFRVPLSSRAAAAQRGFDVLI